MPVPVGWGVVLSVRKGGYNFILWVEIDVDSAEQRIAVRAELVRIHVPSERTESAYRAFDYARTGEAVGYIES